MKNRWDPRRGASLRTFFIGQCLIRFLDVYRQWLKEQGLEEKLVGKPLRDKRTSPDPAVTTTQRLEAEAALSALDSRTAEVLRLHAEDLPQEEIAHYLSKKTGEPVSRKAVESMLYRYRQRQQRRGA